MECLVCVVYRRYLGTKRSRRCSSFHRDPIPPCLPFPVRDALLLTLIAYHAEIVDVAPMGATAVPAGFVHQADERFFLGPALVDGHVGEVRGAKASAMMGKGDAEAVGAKGPVERVECWGEGGEKRDGDGEGWEFVGGDGRESSVFECAMRENPREDN